MSTSNALDIPDVLIDPSRMQSRATYMDLNPVPNAGLPVILYDTAAVFAAVRNLLLCPHGGRSRTFEPDYGSGLYDLLQEPADDINAVFVGSAVTAALNGWEPRLNLAETDVQVQVDNVTPGYTIRMTLNVNGTRTTAEFRTGA